MQKDGKASEKCQKTKRSENFQAGLIMKKLLEREGQESCILREAKNIDKHFPIIQTTGPDSMIILPGGQKQESASDPPTQ